MFHDHPAQCQKNKRIAGHINSTHKKGKQTVNKIKQLLLGNCVNWNTGCVQVFVVWIFLYLYFIKNSAVQRLETDVKCTLPGSYF